MLLWKQIPFCYGKQIPCCYGNIPPYCYENIPPYCYGNKPHIALETHPIYCYGSKANIALHISIVYARVAVISCGPWQKLSPKTFVFLPSSWLSLCLAHGKVAGERYAFPNTTHRHIIVSQHLNSDP